MKTEAWIPTQAFFQDLYRMLPFIGEGLALTAVVWLSSLIVATAVGKNLRNQGLGQPIPNAAEGLISGFGALVGMGMALSHWGLGWIALGILVSLGILVTIAWILAGDLLRSAGARLLWAAGRSAKKGDIVEVHGMTGSLESINWFHLQLRKQTGEKVMLPNHVLWDQPMLQLEKGGIRRVEIQLGVPQEADLSMVESILKSSVSGLECLADNKPVSVFAEGFGDSSILFRVQYWVPYPSEGLEKSIHEGMLAIKKALDAHDISLPVPMRSLDFASTDRDLLALPFLEGGGGLGRHDHGQN